MKEKLKEKVLTKRVMTAVISLLTLSLGIGIFAFTNNELGTPTPNSEQNTPTPTKTTKTEKQHLKETEETATPEPNPETVVEQDTPPIQQEPVAPATAPESATQQVQTDPMTREWTDGNGNQYIGPNAISCGDGSAPIQPNFGLPAMCQISDPE